MGTSSVWSAPDCEDPKHQNKPACSDGGGGDAGSDIAFNDIFARLGARCCFLYSYEECGKKLYPGGCPQPQGTHTPYKCTQHQADTFSIMLSGGQVLDTQNSPTQDGVDTCNGTFEVLDVYANRQYVVVAGGGEVCTDEDGCPIRIQTALTGHEGTPYNSIKIVGDGRGPQSENLNPFACPSEGDPVSATYQLDTIQIHLKNGKGAKYDLVCLFDVSGESGNSTSFTVTPDCP